MLQLCQLGNIPKIASASALQPNEDQTPDRGRLCRAAYQQAFRSKPMTPMRGKRPDRKLLNDKLPVAPFASSTPERGINNDRVLQEGIGTLSL